MYTSILFKTIFGGVASIEMYVRFSHCTCMLILNFLCLLLTYSFGCFCSDDWTIPGKRSQWPISTTWNNLLEQNRTRPSIVTKERHRDRPKSTRLLPIVHNNSSSTLKTVLEQHRPTPTLPVRSPRVLGRPASCPGQGSSNTYHEGDEQGCPSFCCVDGDQALVPTAAKLPPVQEGPLDSVHDDDPNIHTKHNEVENPPPAATNTIDGSRKPKHSWRSSHNRPHRSADDFVYENSNFEPPPVTDHNGVVITLRGSTMNQTLGSEFCAYHVIEYTQCLDKTASNYTYHIPISRYFPDDVIYVEFLFQRGKNRSEVEVCNVTPLLGDCGATRTTSEKASPKNPAIFVVEFGNHASTTVKYRVPLNYASLRNTCHHSKQDLGVTYLEYNLFFYRECED